MRVSSYRIEKPLAFIQEPQRAKIERSIKNIIFDNDLQRNLGKIIINPIS